MNNNVNIANLWFKRFPSPRDKGTVHGLKSEKKVQCAGKPHFLPQRSQGLLNFFFKQSCPINEGMWSEEKKVQKV